MERKKELALAVVCIILLVASIGGNLWLWTSLNQANSEITSLETTVSAKSSEIEDLEANISTKNSEIEALESEVSSLEADKNNLQSQVSSLETKNNQLQTWLYDNKSQISSLKASVLGLENEIESLKDENTWQKQHSFTYYTVGDDTSISVGDDIRISNVVIYEVGGPIGWVISGTITNIGEKPIGPIYVYRVLRNPDGTADFSTHTYVEILHLFVGEIKLFTFPSIDYDESQTVEIFVIY